MNKWNEFFEKQALEDLKASAPPDSSGGDVSETETEQAGENAEKELNEQNDENEQNNETKGKNENEGSEQETGKKETV